MKNPSGPKRSFPVGKSKTFRKVHYVLSTHWDREWYQSFQDYRRRLVKLLDRVLEDLRDGRLIGPFTTDGQAVMLEDYLEIRPEKKELVGRFAKAGKLKIGPWYVIPDEWLVSGESLIRNLRLGRHIARQLGGVASNAGFVCDTFGHIGQLPQIFRGFGIGMAFLWRGLEPSDRAIFSWRGSDGIEIPCFRFGRSGYGDYSFDVRHCIEPDHTFIREEALADLRVFLDKEAKRAGDGPILLFDGADHLEYEEDHYRMLFGQNAESEFPYEVVASTLDDYIKDVSRSRGSIPNVVVGELRETGGLPATKDAQWLIPGVLSSRIWIKQENADCQALLCYLAEPFASVATLLTGSEYPQGFLDVAWRWLLLNHPHDSICGCSIDEVHQDMKYRFAQCRQIAVAQISESLKKLGASVKGELSQTEMRVLIANPLLQSIDEIVELRLEIPSEWGCFQEFFGFEPMPAFRIYDDAGSELSYQRLAQEMGRSKIFCPSWKFPSRLKTNNVSIAVQLRVPALGYGTITVRQGELTPRIGVIAEYFPPTRHPQSPGLARSECSMENEFLLVVVNKNGSLKITDKRSGEIYDGLHAIENIADIGDGWYHGQCVNDQRFVSAGAQADIALVHDGALLCRFRIRTKMQVPKQFDFARMARSDEMAVLLCDSFVTLRRGCDRVEIRTVVDNCVRDHRVRVLFPTGVRCDSYFSDGAFDVTERRIGLPVDNHLRRELAVETTPQQSWTAVAKQGRGLAIVSSGLPESAVCDLEERPIALTLFRAVRRTVLTDGQDDGQLQQRMAFHYWIVPLSEGIPRSRLFRDGVQLAAGLQTAQLTAHEIPLYRTEMDLPASASLLNIDGEVVVTSVRHVDGKLEVRFFNPNEAAERISIRFPASEPSTRFHFVARVDFESKIINPKRKIKSKVDLIVNPKEIVTLQFA